MVADELHAPRGDGVWLTERWYDIKAQERLRQLALWSPRPVLLYANTGLPIRAQESASEEIARFSDEGVVQLWTYEGERLYDESLAPAALSDPFVVDRDTYRGITGFVSERLEHSLPAIEVLGFQDAEGMLLEQVVLRRRFFTQAVAAALDAGRIGDGPQHAGLYRFDAQIQDALVAFAETQYLPSLALLDLDDYLALRARAQALLPELVTDLEAAMVAAGPRALDHKRVAVERLHERYRDELVRLSRGLTTRSGTSVADAFQDGIAGSLETRLALYRAGEVVPGARLWSDAAPDETMSLAVFMLDWRSGLS